MDRPTLPKILYLDFDKYFASVMQAKYPALRGRPVGVLPFEGARTILISCSKEARARGVSSLMAVRDARAICPDIILACQEPDLFARAHKFLLSEINMVVPLDVVKSIDEIAVKLDPVQSRNPEAIGLEIKRRLLKEVGPWITCSIGFAANRTLAKMAVEQDKPDGLTVWWPDQMPGPLLRNKLSDVPGIGDRMVRRLERCDITDMAGILATQPKQLRAIWKSVGGERMWYALQGYDIEAQPTKRDRFGHGKRLPAWTMAEARYMARELTLRAARRMRRNGFSASLYTLYVAGEYVRYAAKLRMPQVCDDAAILGAFARLWADAETKTSRHSRVYTLDVSMTDLTLTAHRQLDLLTNDEWVRRKQEAISKAKDDLNARYCDTVVSNGPRMKNIAMAGQKISYSRIPDPEDFF